MGYKKIITVTILACLYRNFSVVDVLHFMGGVLAVALNVSDIGDVAIVNTSQVVCSKKI